MMRCLSIGLAMLLLLWGAAVAAQEATAVYGPDRADRRLILRGTTDIAVFGPVIEAFLQPRPQLAITYEQWSSNALYEATGRACGEGTSQADLIISSAVHQMVRLVNDACARPYRSALTQALPERLRWRDELWGVTQEPAVIVYNRGLVPAAEAPESRFDLLDLLRPGDSRYAGRVATYDIEASGLGYLFAFMDAQEATTFGGLLESFGRAEVEATCCSAEIISGVAEGRYLIAYNVLGSYALARAAEDPRIAVVAPRDYTLVLARAAMIPRWTRAPDLAADFLDFLLDEPGRRALRDSLLILPEQEPGGLLDPEGRTETVTRGIALSPALLPALDRQKRMLFIERWRETFPRRPRP